MLKRFLLLGAWSFSSFVLGMQLNADCNAKIACDPCQALDQMLQMDPSTRRQRAGMPFLKRVTTDSNDTHKFTQDLFRLSLACQRQHFELAPGSTARDFSLVKKRD